MKKNHTIVIRYKEKLRKITPFGHREVIALCYSNCENDQNRRSNTFYLIYRKGGEKI